MSAQTRYGFSTPGGVAGGIYDLAPIAVDTLLVGEETGVMKFGVGVVQGDKPGTDAKLPADGSDDSTKFEGVTVNGRTTELDLEGASHIRKGASIGIMRYGRAYCRVAEDAEPAYGKPAYVVYSSEKGENGYMTDKAEGGFAIPARFLGGKDEASGLAVVELFNAPGGQSLGE